MRHILHHPDDSSGIYADRLPLCTVMPDEDIDATLSQIRAAAEAEATTDGVLNTLTYWRAFRRLVTEHMEQVED